MGFQIQIVNVCRYCLYILWLEYWRGYRVWKSCKSCSSCSHFKSLYTSLRQLIDMSLVECEYSPLGDVLAMHNLLRDMGEEIGWVDGSHLSKDEVVQFMEDIKSYVSYVII